MARNQRAEQDELNLQESAAPEATEELNADGTDKEDGKVYINDAGQPISRSAWIRQEFAKDRSRGEIAKEIGVPYGIVYSATANLENAVHKAGENGSVVRGVTVTDSEGKVISRAELFRQRIKEGATRGQLAKEFNVPYSTVYAATKDETVKGEGGRTGGRIVVEVDGNHVPRAQYIREQFAAGKTRREIANELHCDYAVVWAATKPSKKETETEAVVAAEQAEYDAKQVAANAEKSAAEFTE